MLPEATAYLPGSITTAGDTTRTSDRLGNKPGASSSHLAQGAMARAAGGDAWRQPCPLRRSPLAAGSLSRDFIAQERQPPGPSGRGAAAGPPTRGRDTPEADSELRDPRVGASCGKRGGASGAREGSRRSRGTGAASRHRRTYRHTRTDRQAALASTPSAPGSGLIKSASALFCLTS